MSINRVVLVGNLTRDPDMRVLPGGTAVCHLRIACNRMHKEADGSWTPRPNFFDVSVFGPQAESVTKFMSKGRLVGIDGRLEWREWQTPDEQKRQAVSIVADTVQFLGRPASAAAAVKGDEAPESPEALEAPEPEGSETPEAASPDGDATSPAEPVDEALIF